MLEAVWAERQACLADVSPIVQESLSVSGRLLGKAMGTTDAASIIVETRKFTIRVSVLGHGGARLDDQRRRR